VLVGTLLAKSLKWLLLLYQTDRWADLLNVTPTTFESKQYLGPKNCSLAISNWFAFVQSYVNV